MIRIEDLDVVAGMERLVVLDPNEIGAGLGHGRARHVDSAANKTVSFFGVILEPTWFVCTTRHEKRKKKKLNERRKKNQ